MKNKTKNLIKSMAAKKVPAWLARLFKYVGRAAAGLVRKIDKAFVWVWAKVAGLPPVAYARRILKSVIRRTSRWPWAQKIYSKAGGLLRRARPALLTLLVLASILIPLYHYTKPAKALTATMNPNADSTVQWLTSSGTTHYSLVNEGTSPNTTSYVHTGTGGTSVLTDQYTLSSVTGVSSASQLVISAYAESATNANGGTLDNLNVNLSVSGVNQTAVSCTPAYNTWAYCSATFTGSWTQAQVNAMSVILTNTINGSGKSSGKEDDIEVADVYGTLTYVPSSVAGQSSYQFFNNQDATSSFQQWQQAHVTPWAVRENFTSLVYNNKMWVMGGVNLNTLTYYNDVWYSSDGVNWTQATASAGWSGRYDLTSMVYNNKMWVMGGDTGSSMNDVWSSSDGVTWTQATASAAWPGKESMVGMVYNNKMWVMGGYSLSTTLDYNDVWSSSDGVTWTEATASAPWSAREAASGFVYNNKMWIMGGYSSLNDVWSSSDGVNWTEATASAGWSGRYGFAGLVYNNKMWVIGGYGSAYNTDVWSSTDGVTWTEVTSTVGWAARDNMSGLVFNSELWIMGGNNGVTYYNDVWSSTDGVNWSVTSSSSIPWTARSNLTTLVYNNKMWVMGGYSGSSYLNDVWSSTDGVNWTEATSAAPWAARNSLTSLVYNNKMWVIGGNNGSGYLNDVWSSTDGVNWTEATAAAGWSARNQMTSFVYNNKMWIAGGWNGGYLNDVWSSADGVTWTQATAAAGWGVRDNLSSTIYNNKMWIMGGYNGSSYYDDVWSSTDGVTWTEATGAAGWSARDDLTSLVYNNQMWVVGGAGSSYYNDAWYSTDGVNWTEATGTAGWSLRINFGSAVYNNKIWIIGGVNGSTHYNEVWSAALIPIDVGTQLKDCNGTTAPRNTPACAPGDGQAFRLRIDLPVTGGSLAVGSGVFKLQYAPMTTSCDASFTNTPTYAYVDVGAAGSTTTVQYYDNPNGGSGEPLTANANDPTDGTNTNAPQTYQESNTFTNSSAIQAGQDGMWDFALTTYHTMPNQSYCLRVVNSDGSVLGGTYSQIPKITIPSAPKFTQSGYRFYQNQDSAYPSSNWTKAAGPNSINDGREGSVNLVYNSKMWVMGGYDSSGNYLNDVWSSSDGANWTEVTSKAPWSARWGAAGVVYNNEMWIFGGQTAGPNDNNDVWYSTDGVNWTEATTSASWAARDSMQAVVYNNEMWIMGGSGSTEYNDVWYSTDGITWTEATTGAAWAGRDSFTAVVYNSKMWVMGGYNGSGGVNDVWSSSDGVTWTQATAAAGWSARDYVHGIVYNNEMWIMGGYDTGAKATMNDVWYSTDGITWTEATTGAAWSKRSDFVPLVLNSDMWVVNGDNFTTESWSSTDGITWTQGSTTSNIPWHARSGFGSFVFNNKMWILGGMWSNGTTTTDYNDVWSSSDGVTWTEATASAGWSARTEFASFVYNNKMWIMGGQDSSGTKLHDVWYSTDGVTWTEATAAAGWDARYGPTGLSYNNKMWLLGGDDGLAVRNGSLNDVWYSTDGITWTEATAAAGWNARANFNSWVYNNAMWITSGFDTYSSYGKDVWYSTDGVTWTEATSSAPWGGRYEPSVVVYNNEMWMMGGTTSGYDAKNDAWYSSDGTNWTEATANAGWGARFSAGALTFNNKLWIMGGITGGGPGYSANGFYSDVWDYSLVSQDVGTPLAAQNTQIDLSGQSLKKPFRMRMLITGSVTGEARSNLSLKLQYAVMAGGSCSATPSANFSDITSTTPIQFYNNTNASSGDTLVVDSNDPTDGTKTVDYQTYYESNPFSNDTTLIYSGEDGLWDFALAVNTGASHASYCLRAVYSSSGLPLDTYSSYPQINVAATMDHLLRQGMWWGSQETKQSYELH